MNREQLIVLGVDYDEGISRFSGHKELYEKYLTKFFLESLMVTLENQLSQNNFSGAFHTAHDLKGVAGNLSLNSFYNEISNLTEALRNVEDEVNLNELFLKAKKIYQNMYNIVMGDIR